MRKNSMLYPIIRSLLFKLPPETAHKTTLKTLALFQQLGISHFLGHKTQTPVTLMGLNFPNLIGLAAGFDKNGDYIDALAPLGFGFIEIGTITPRPQPGNPKPRLFRLPQAQALINRMGFNNQGVDYLVNQVKQAKYSGILGINIGKNFDTPLEQAAQDYLFCFERVYAHASYITVNISSPNTKGLRDLQDSHALTELLSVLKTAQYVLAQQQQKYVPLVVKIAPDLDSTAIEAMAAVFLQQKVDGVIATNTTLSREGVTELPHATETGGLSGRPVFAKSLSVVRQLSHHLQGKIPIIGCGGIMSAQDRQTMLDAGASLVQIYTGLIYQGLGLLDNK